MGRNLKMPWSMEDTIENMDNIRDMLINQVRKENLDKKGEEDVKEINFEFGRVKEALKNRYLTAIHAQAMTITLDVGIV